MKSTSIMILAGLFAAQLVAAGVLYYNTNSQRAVRPQGSLLSLSADVVDQISIESESESVILEKSGDRWSLGASGLPADQTKVDNILETLTDLKSGWAVATSESSHQQLQVADNKYQRRVMMSQGDDMVGDLYLGTSPGFKRSHARIEGADEVYSVAVNTYDLPAVSDDWLDKTLLQVADVRSVTLQEKVLVQEEERWIYDGNDRTDQDKAAGLVKLFDGLRVIGVAEAVDDVEFEVVTLNAGDSTYEYRFGVSDDNEYLVGRQDFDSVFTLSKSSYDTVIESELLLPEPNNVVPGDAQTGSEKPAGSTDPLAGDTEPGKGALINPAAVSDVGPVSDGPASDQAQSDQAQTSPAKEAAEPKQ